MLEYEKDIVEKMVEDSGFSEEKIRHFIRHMEATLLAMIQNPEKCNGRILVNESIVFNFRKIKAVRQWYRCLLGYNNYSKKAEIYNDFLKPKMTKYVKVRQEDYAKYGFGKNNEQPCGDEVSGVEHYKEVVHPWNGKPGNCWHNERFNGKGKL